MVDGVLIFADELSEGCLDLLLRHLAHIPGLSLLLQLFSLFLMLGLVLVVNVLVLLNSLFVGSTGWHMELLSFILAAASVGLKSR